MSTVQSLLRNLPSMERVLTDRSLMAYLDLIERPMLKLMVRRHLDSWRDLILSGQVVDFSQQRFFEELCQELERKVKVSLRPVLNGTGVVIHTNLGRSALAPEAVQAVADVAQGYSTLEFNLDQGCRGHRNDHLEWLLCQITGAEAALVVNNNASAVLLALAALAKGREAVVSRGELVEIGGSFRIPQIMEFAGVNLVEVGCTNRTHLKDYQQAIGDQTAMVLKVHPSNFRISGFTSSVPREELSELAREKKVLFVEDLGSGLLIDGDVVGIDEPSVRDCLRAGCDLVTFSGDKMLGGPQLGVLVGRKSVLDQIRNCQLLRALRCDKMSLAAMEATLRLYLRGQWMKLPTLRRIAVQEDLLQRQAQDLKKVIDEKLKVYCLVTSVVETEDAVGGGSYPERPLKGWAVAVQPQSPITSGKLAEALRHTSVPLILGGRDGRLLLHLRTIDPDQYELVVDQLRQAMEVLHGN